MTQDKNIQLTSEEQALLQEQAPEIWQRLQAGNPIAQITARGWLHARQNSIAENAKSVAEEIKRDVIAAIDAEPEQCSLLSWCGFPTDMTRVSPFFPMQRNELGNRPYLKNHLITSGNWGELRYSGPKLSTYDEDVLMVLLALIFKKSKYVHEMQYVEPGLLYHNALKEYNYKLPDNISVKTDNENIRQTYLYSGPIYPILKMLGYKNPSKKDYIRLLSSLENLATASIKNIMSGGKTKTGKKRAPRKILISTILAGVYWNEEEKRINTVINPYFLETYKDRYITYINIEKRITIKGVIAKALYRFVQSQRKAEVFTGHFLTLTDLLNMDREQPLKETRRQLKTAINELIRQSVLQKKSGFINTDIIKLNRTSDALPPNAQKKIGEE